MSLGSILRKERKDCGLTIMEVQKETNITNLCRYEKDAVNPSFQSIVKLARYYAVDLEYLAKAV